MNIQKIASLAKYLPAAELEAVLQSLYPQDVRLQPKTEAPRQEPLVLLPPPSQVVVPLRVGTRAGIAHKWPANTLVQVNPKRRGRPFADGGKYSALFDAVKVSLADGARNRTGLAQDVALAHSVTPATVSGVISRALRDRYLQVWQPA